MNLDQPSVLVSRETRQSKCDVVTCQWSLLDENRVAVASNNKVSIRTVQHVSEAYSHVTYSHVIGTYWIKTGWLWPATAR